MYDVVCESSGITIHTVAFECIYLGRCIG